jgi:hypothetical protein
VQSALNSTRLSRLAKSKAKLIVAKLDPLSRNVSFLLKLIDPGVEFLFADPSELNGAALAAVGETDLKKLKWFAIHTWRGSLQAQQAGPAHPTRISGTAA